MTFPFRGNGLTPVGASSPLKVWYDGQSNGGGQGITLSQAIAGSYHYTRRSGDDLRAKGLWQRVGAYARDQAVDSSLTGILRTLTAKHGSQVALASAAIAGGRTPIIVSTGRSGTDCTGWASGAAGYTLFDQVAAEVLPTLGTSNWVYIWSQGESDAQNSPLSSNYETRFGAWIDHVRTALPGCYIVARLMPSGLTGSFKAAVNTAIQNVITAKGNGVAQDTDAVIDSTNATNYVTPHWTSVGLAALGAAEYTIAAAHA